MSDCQECERLTALLAAMRAKLHAANRPKMREGLRIELRDMIDAALAKQRGLP